MPFVADTGKAAADPVGELLAEFARPLPHGFMADNDAAGGQQLLHHAKAEREAEVQPHGMTDDVDREPVPGVASASGCRHPIRLLTPIRRRKYPGSTKLTVPPPQRAVKCPFQFMVSQFSQRLCHRFALHCTSPPPGAKKKTAVR